MADPFTILVVEDEECIREGICEYLGMENFAVVAAQDGREALEKLDAAKRLPDVILLDLNMHVMSGLDFLKVKAERVEWERIPVIVMTAVPNVTVENVAGFLRKPLNLDALMARLAVLQGQ